MARTASASTLVHAKPGSRVRMLGYDHDLVWRQDARGLTIDLPQDLQTQAKRPCLQSLGVQESRIRRLEEVL